MMANNEHNSQTFSNTSTFETYGVSKQEARAYLKTEEGMRFWDMLSEADPSATEEQITNRAVEQITSGADLPKMETIHSGESLVKIVPHGTTPTPYTPYFTTEPALNKALTSGQPLKDHFGLPNASAASSYDVYKITAKEPTVVFTSTVAPTSEKIGDAVVNQNGGTRQTLVLNRGEFDSPAYVKSVDEVHVTLPTNISKTLELETLDRTANIKPGAARVNMGLKVAGTAAVAYDAVNTGMDVKQALDANNTTAAQSSVLHFGGRNLGMLGGAVLGAKLVGGIGAFAGPEGAAAGAAIGGIGGGIGGAVAGDWLASTIDAHRIYNQSDPQGNTWHYEPSGAEQGWTRVITTGELDPDVTAASGIPIFKTQTLHADPELTNRLNYKASSTAVELALGHPPTPKDPYSQPSEENNSLPWVRDPQTHAWSRTVIDMALETSTVTHEESANATQTAQLNRSAQRTVEENLTHSPQGMAQQFGQAYERNGWSRFGPAPEYAIF